MTSILSVTTPASDRNLLTVAELRAAVGVTDASQDAKLVTLGNRVSATITAACRVTASGAVPPTLRLETLSEQFRLKSTQDILVLSRRPIVSLDTVVENAVALDVDYDCEFDSVSGAVYRLLSDDRICWPCGKIVFGFSAGWATVPEDLKLAASKLAAVLWSEADVVDTSSRRVDVPGLINIERWASGKDDPLVPTEIYEILENGGYVNRAMIG